MNQELDLARTLRGYRVAEFAESWTHPQTGVICHNVWLVSEAGEVIYVTRNERVAKEFVNAPV